MNPTNEKTMTIEQLIHESNLIEGYDDPEFDAQGMLAWEYLKKVELGELWWGNVSRVQRMLVLKQTDLQPNWRGYYREIEVTVGGHKLPRSFMVIPLMDHWIREIKDKDVDPIEAHIAFEIIHPFVDGNGRTGRLLMWWHQTKLGQPSTSATPEMIEIVAAEWHVGYGQWLFNNKGLKEIYENQIIYRHSNKGDKWVEL